MVRARQLQVRKLLFVAKVLQCTVDDVALLRCVITALFTAHANVHSLSLAKNL